MVGSERPRWGCTWACTVCQMDQVHQKMRFIVFKESDARLENWKTDVCPSSGDGSVYMYVIHVCHDRFVFLYEPIVYTFVFQTFMPEKHPTPGWPPLEFHPRPALGSGMPWFGVTVGRQVAPTGGIYGQFVLVMATEVLHDWKWVKCIFVAFCLDGFWIFYCLLNLLEWYRGESMNTDHNFVCNMWVLALMSQIKFLNFWDRQFCKKNGHPICIRILSSWSTMQLIESISAYCS